MLKFKTFFTVMLLFLLSACSNSEQKRVILSFCDDLNNTTIPITKDLQIKVFTNYSDGTKENVTDLLIWSSSDETLATVNGGLVSAKSVEGSLNISYKTKEKSSDGSAIYENTFPLIIKKLILKEIKLSQTSISLSIGASKSIQAMGIYDDNGTSNSIDITDSCSWSSSDINISTVDKGLVKGVSEGNATITATDNNISSDSLAVEVTTIKYVSLTLQASKTEFNVEQTIDIVAIATTDKDENITLENSSLIWESDSTNVEITSGIATAMIKGKATISAKISTNSDIESSITLDVIRGKYMRLFREDGTEIDFATPDINNFNIDDDAILAKFVMSAVGKDFTISNLKITNFSGLPIGGNSLTFIDLNNGDIIRDIDGNTTFELSHDSNHEEISYSFKIDDDNTSSFVQKYKALGIRIK